MSLLDALARLLDELELGSYTPEGEQAPVDWSVWLETQPAEPARVISLFSRPGGDSPAGQPWEEPHVQVRVRGDADSAVSYERARLLYRRLHGLSYRDLHGGLYLVDCIAQQSGPVPAGPDANGLHQHTVNLRLSIEYSTPVD